MAPSLTTSQTLLCPDCFEWPNADFLVLVHSMTHDAWHSSHCFEWQIADVLGLVACVTCSSKISSYP